ncbi:glycine cleavage system aminomethyltransferase GcvT [Laceyella sacchari]|jgi:aminomethyltransferase|uniref:Aminomethyltransferase n=1 Tax=Laceyella sacchari TaxID=37482 RepID=A0ABY5U6F8_LACSH|nr:glycine cleavage system aminomethyltransferase GcvT [Laceyella sacchari]UWE04744.1 glycine cleavage system aminomethyltransferase GcvT [Laceyella sacchari]
MSELKRTPLYETYCTEAKMVPFGGWEMPVQFVGIKQEHEAVRTKAGLFDVSHMGEVRISGSGALSFIQKITTNDASRLQIGDAQYAIMCYPDGGTVDDLLVYRTGENEYLLVINASNIEKDVAWMKKHQTDEVKIENISDDIAQLALQGPLAESVLQTLTETDLSEIKFFKFKQNVNVAGVPTLVSRTGYTGEDGFELYFARAEAPKLWREILAAGKEQGVLPCGLGARDTLRFEARLPLYGQELSPEISPLEAGLGFAVKLDKGDFIGRDALAKQKESGLARKLVGIEMIDRGIPRSHYPVYAGDERIGEVTTGTQSPTLKKNVGLALLKTEFTDLDQVVEVEIRGKRLKARVVKVPFYKRPK